MITFDLNKPPPKHTVTVSVDRDESPGERFVRLTKELVVFLLAVGFVCVLVWICLRTVFDLSASPEAQKWAMSILSAAGAGMIGYLVRR